MLTCMTVACNSLHFSSTVLCTRFVLLLLLLVAQVVLSSHSCKAVDSSAMPKQLINIPFIYFWCEQVGIVLISQLLDATCCQWQQQ